MKLSYFLLFLLILCSCSTPQLDLQIATPFFPSLKTYKQGIVHKYYLHNTPADKNASPSTDIEYHHYQFEEPDLLYCDEIDAAFELKWRKKYQLKEGKMILLEYDRFYKRETCETTIKENIELDWVNEKATLNLKVNYEKFETAFISNIEQTSITDTIIEDIACKKVQWLKSIERIQANDTTNFIETQSKYYAKGIGLFAKKITAEKYQLHLELIEQMSVADFEKKESQCEETSRLH